MSLTDGKTADFSPPIRQIGLMLMILAFVALAGSFLFGQIRTVFFANVYLNLVITGVFVIGVMATFWQVAQLSYSARWLRNIQAGHKGVEFVKPPSILAAMEPVVREGKMQKRLASSTTRSVLDSVATRLDEARDITRYISNLLIFLGLLGTFWGLSKTVPAVVDTIRSLAPQDGEVSDGTVFDRLMIGLESQLGGMGTAFASSLLGLAGSLVVGLLELFAGHGQNRFFRELEDWLTSFTRLGLVGEGEGPEGALMALLERVDEGLEKTTEFAAKAEVARIEAESRLGRAADVVAEMANQIDRERSVVTQIVNELRESRDMATGREHATLAVLKRIDQGQANMAAAQQSVAKLMEASFGTRRSSMDPEMRGLLKNIDQKMALLGDEISSGRQEAVGTLRAELRALIQLIDARTKGG